MLVIFKFRVWRNVVNAIGFSRYIPAMKNLMKQIGKEEFLEMLKTSSEMLYENDKDADIDYSESTLTAYANNVKQTAKGYYIQRATFEFIHSDENNLELKIVECCGQRHSENQMHQKLDMQVFATKIIQR